MTALLALSRRDFIGLRSYRTAFVFDLAWGVIDLVLYYFISRVVGDVPAADLDGAPSYFAFAVAGILVSLIVGSATTDSASRIREEQLTGTLEILCAQPLRAVQLAFGTAAFPFAYAVARVCMYLVITVAFLSLDTSTVDWLGVVVILVLSGFAFVPLGILAAAATVVFKRGGAIVDAAIFAMTFVSGALFPIAVLPGWLEAIGKVMPTRFAYDGLRSALFTDGGWAGDAAVLLLIAVVGIPLSVWVFDRALGHAKRKGTLSQY